MFSAILLIIGIIILFLKEIRLTTKKRLKRPQSIYLGIFLILWSVVLFLLDLKYLYNLIFFIVPFFLIILFAFLIKKTEPNKEELEKTPIKKDLLNVPFLLLCLVSIGFTVWMIYGTIHPCGILKKEISSMMSGSRQIRNTEYIYFEEPTIHFLIDRMSPAECLSKVFTIKFKVDTQINDIIRE